MRGRILKAPTFGGGRLLDITNILNGPWTFRDWIISITPFLLTIISIVLAIYVPYRIMNKQNKIALFEKKYIIYQETESILQFSNAVEKLKVLPNNINSSTLEISKALFSIWINSNENVQSIFSMTQDDVNSLNNHMKRITAINYKLSSQKSTLYSSQFLFTKEYFILFSNLADRYVNYTMNLRDCFEGHLVDNNADLILDDKTCAFTILIKGKVNDIPARRINLEKARQIGLDVISRLKKYKRTMTTDYLKWRGFDINSVSYFKVGPVFDDAYGYRFTFVVASPENLAYDATKWND